MSELKNLRYDDATNVIRKELPGELELTAASAIYVTVASDDGGELVARGAATIYTATTLDAAVSAGASSFVLDSGADDLEPGDRIRILDSDAGRDEDLVVDFYDSSTQTVHPVQSLRSSHSSGAAVIGLFATTTIDTTDTGDYTKGRTIVLTWEHGADESSAFKWDTDTYTIGASGFGSDDVLERFATYFPSLHDKVRERVDAVRTEAMRALRYELKAAGLDMDRVVDQELIMIPLVFKIALIAAGISDQYETERVAIMADYKMQFDRLVSMPIWVDTDQDLIKDDDELKSHKPLAWGRGM